MFVSVLVMNAVDISKTNKEFYGYVLIALLVISLIITWIVTIYTTRKERANEAKRNIAQINRQIVPSDTQISNLRVHSVIENYERDPIEYEEGFYTV